MNTMNASAAAAAAVACDNKSKKLHIVMFPWVGFGHIITFLQLSKFIAQKGHNVSFVSTTRNIDRLQLLNLSKDNESQITFVKLTLTSVEGLPENAEASMDIDRHQIPYLMKAMDGLEPQLTRFLEAELPDWIIYDISPYWLPSVATKLGISTAFFMTSSAWVTPFYISLNEATVNRLDSQKKKHEDRMVPPRWLKFLSEAPLKPYELEMIAKNSAQKDPSDVSLGFRMTSIVGGSDALLTRHCMEFEPEWISLSENLYKRPMIPVGLMPPAAEDSKDDVENDVAWLDIKEWLDMQDKRSVVYVAMGSEVSLSQDQLTELALGLEQSRLPFFWALKKSGSTDLPEGYLETNKGRGMVWTSWAPQLKILSHDSVGGYMTHCGWASLVEGMMLGKPFIMLPFYDDQGINARIIAGRKLGKEVQRNEVDGSFTRDSVADALSLVMVGDEGKIFKDNIEETSKINDKDLHNKYIDNLVNYLVTKREAHNKIV